MFRFNSKNTEGRCLPKNHLGKPSATGKSENVCRLIAIQKRESAIEKSKNEARSKKGYKNFDDLTSRVKLLKINSWTVEYSIGHIELRKHNSIYVLPQYELYITSDFYFTIRVFGWKLPDTHSIYKSYFRTIQNTTVSRLVQDIDLNYELCQGITPPELKNAIQLKKHTLTKKYKLQDENATINDEQCQTNIYDETKISEPTFEDEYLRGIDCATLIEINKSDQLQPCSECNSFSLKEVKFQKRKRVIANTPANLRAPISLTSPQRIRLTLQKQRLDNAQLIKEAQELREEIDKSSVPVDKVLNIDLQNIIQDIFNNVSQKRKISPFMKLFIEEQLKYLTQDPEKVQYHPMIIKYLTQDPEKVQYHPMIIKYLTQDPEKVQYHPMIIKFCLGLHAKSAAAYEQLRLDKNGTGVLVLPSQRTLSGLSKLYSSKTGLQLPNCERAQGKNKIIF